MKLSAEQLKTFHRIQRKHNVSGEFLLRNMPAILRFVHYAITPHLILMKKLVRKNNRVFLRYNHLRKLIFDASQFKKNRRIKRLRLQWSKRLVTHLKAHKTVEYVEDEDVTVENKLHEKDVSKQLKEQLELLKSGKRIVPLLEDAEQKETAPKTPTVLTNGDCEVIDVDENQSNGSNNAEVASAANERTEATESNGADILNSEGKSCEELESCGPAESMQTNQPELDEKGKENNISQESLKRPNNEPEHITQDTNEIPKRQSTTADRGNGKFLDMLISRVRSTTEDANDGHLMEPPKKIVRSSADGFHHEERENSNSSSDFCGFDDSECIRGTFPGMLSTPLVQKRDSNAAFESETLNAFMRDNSLETSTTMDLPKRPPEDGLVSIRAVPPKLDMPALPEGLQGLRTVAERRMFLQRTKNAKYCVINNVGTIFRELQKRSKGHRINKNAIEAIQNSSTMPLTRASWKASSWLLTDDGNYYFQTINIDGKDYRLGGSRANNADKYKKPHSNDLKKLPSICPKNCIDRITFRALRPIRAVERRSKLDDASKRPVYKACPLSQKILQHSKDNQLTFDSLEVVRMPQVELEVFPQLQKPLNDIAKRYLQLILPYGGISREWAEFSVSTLLDQKKDELASSGMRKSFTFKIPYANDRDTVLVRRVFNRSETFEGHLDKSTLTFRKEIDDKKAKGQAVDDKLEEECADVLTDMINSVAISCCENSFMNDDPDNIYQNRCPEEVSIAEKTAKKSPDLHPHHPHAVAGPQNKKQSRLLMELKRLNATIIDAAVSKTDEDTSTCEKESCKLGCVCASLNEGTTVRQHCGKQKCILDCNCKCPGIMRLETDGRTITTEDAFMLRRRATARLARMEKEFTSTIVLTGSETLLINESQYDKKRRCTKVPKRYGDFVDPDESDLDDCKPSKKVEEVQPNLPLEPIMVNEKIYQRLKHCTVNIKRMRGITDLASWCLIHNVYNCFCRGQSTVGNPIVVEKQEEHPGGTTTDETTAAAKNRALYSFEKEESKTHKRKEDAHISNCDTESTGSTDSVEQSNRGPQQTAAAKPINRSTDNEIIENFLNAKLNECRRVVPIPKHTYVRRNKKRVAHVQLFIAENETEQTKLNLSEHVLRSVYYHKTYSDKRKALVVNKKEPIAEGENESENILNNHQASNLKEKRKSSSNIQQAEDASEPKRSRMSIADVEKGASLLLVNQYKDNKKKPMQKTISSESLPPSSLSPDQITIPKISQIFSLNSNAPSNVVEMGTDTAAAAAADIPKQSTEATAAAGVSSEAFRSVFQVVIKNMNNLVSKKMQDIDMALRRESKSIPVPNDEILCIIRWNNFLTSYQDGFVYLWEVQTANETFLAATIKNVMPLVVNALSVVNIRASAKDRLPLLARMLVEKTRNGVTDTLAVVMQGQKLYWYVKGFLRPDKDRICPKPTPETHPLLTKKINVLCRLLINQQINDHKKRQEVALKAPTQPPLPSPALSSSSNLSNSSHHQVDITPRLYQPSLSTKLKVLPIQRNISDHAATILEQMVIQAYGVMQTNVVFRKIHQREIFEICQPATLTLDHHWLVLDISTDFSHIFIPELKDLLTLDRIQKVISYAVNKDRIVKMQFNQKALFNAYVAPLSRRKLYFGPFRSSNHCPRLVLLQSVDGQMMLREVYEKKHNIAERTDKTTGFWLVQKRGKVFLDVLTETQNTSSDEVHEILDDDVTFVPNTPSADISQSQPNDIPNSQNQRDEDENDDDCVIIEDEVSKERTHYTISYTDDNAALVVTPSGAPDRNNAAVDTVHDKFTMLKAVARVPQVDDVNLSATEQLPAPETTHFSISIGETEKAVDSTNTIMFQDNEVVIIPENIVQTAAAEACSVSESTLVPPKTPMVIESTEPVTTNGNIEGRENAAKIISMPTSTIKFNKSVTITKLPVDTVQTSPQIATQQDTITFSRKSLPNATAVNKKSVMQQNQKRLSVPLMKPNPNKQSLLNQNFKPRPCSLPKQMTVSKLSSTSLSQQKPPTVSPSKLNPLQQPLMGPRGPGTATGSLIVRTPTAINTSVRNQTKRELIRQPVGKQSAGSHSLLKPINPGIRMRVPVTAISSANMPITTLVRSPNSVNQQQMPLKHPLLPARVIQTTKRKQPYTTPQQVQFIRYMKNQAKLVDKLNETITQPNSRASPQNDPLQITEGSPNTPSSELLQPQLPSDVKTVRITHPTLREEFEHSPGSSQGPQLGGLKRNANGSILKPSALPKTNQKLPGAPIDPVTVVTPLTGDDPEQSSEFRGIPIDLPRMKKFAIISAPNTTVITPPPSARLIEEYFEGDKSSTSGMEVVEKSPRVQAQNVITIQKSQTHEKPDALPAIGNKSLIKLIPNSSTPSDAVGSVRAKGEVVTEYGYFQANIEGLPKFVVKRIGQDFLVKVPNFNGILKLNGIQTVYNYLNQYTTQKCGKTPEEIVNLKWTFKTQDRSKLANAKNPVQRKPLHNNKLLSSQQVQSQSISSLKAQVKKPTISNTVVLLDDE